MIVPVHTHEHAQRYNGPGEGTLPEEPFGQTEASDFTR